MTTISPKLTAALAWLLDHGADPNAGPYQGAAHCTSPPPSERLSASAS